jgi:NAD(P)-dependent dehydrogenase (short-subunit alcohol dehydrogenase family)
MSRLQGKVSIVTGGATGIGAACARRLGAEGAVVVIADVNEEAAAKVAEEMRADGAEASAVRTDVSEQKQWEELVGGVVERHGGLDILFNNAAILNIEHVAQDINAVEIPVEVWDRTFAVNVRGTMLGCKFAIPEMQKRGGGAIINTSSVSSLYGDPALFSYGASKAAVTTLSKHVAVNFGRSGIRCNSLVPGPIITETVESFMSDTDLKLLGHHVTAPRVGQPEDVAGVVAFLASEDAIYINGAEILVDGGWMAKSPHWADWNDVKPTLDASPSTSLGDWVAKLGS